jgi:hypothetical protein
MYQHSTIKSFKAFKSFPLPRELLCVIFEKSRALKRIDGRNLMKPTIVAFERSFALSQSRWTLKFETHSFRSSRTPGSHNALVLIRFIKVPLPFERPYYMKIWIRNLVNMPTWEWESGAIDVDVDDEDDDNDDNAVIIDDEND